MRSLLCCLILTASLCTSCAKAQVAATPQLAVATPAQLDTLLFFSDFEQAKAAAEVQEADILMVFAGSDWCRPCKQFRQSVLDDVGFRESVKGDVVVLYLDFPSKRRNQLPEAQTAHNAALAERYNPSGIFPKVLVLDANEKLVGDLEYRGQTAEEFRDLLRASRAAK